MNLKSIKLNFKSDISSLQGSRVPLLYSWCVLSSFTLSVFTPAFHSVPSLPSPPSPILTSQLTSPAFPATSDSPNPLSLPLLSLHISFSQTFPSLLTSILPPTLPAVPYLLPLSLPLSLPLLCPHTPSLFYTPNAFTETGGTDILKN